MTTAPQTVDLLIEARWVVPVQPAGVVLEDHAVIVNGDRIVAILPTPDAHAAYAPRQTVALPEHALIPGLVNAHTHNPMALLRGVADDLPLMTWLKEHIWPIEGRVMGPEFVRDGVELAVAEMLRGGTTCANENYFFPDSIAATYKRLGFRACVGLPVIDFPSTWAKTPDEYFDKALAVHDDLRGEPLVTTSFAPHAPYTVSDASFERIRVLSDQLDIPVHLHLLETAGEVTDSRRDHGLTPMQRLQKLGLVNDHLTAVHMTAISDADIELCAERGVSVVHCPESNLKLASGFCPVDKIHHAGINVAIGTDGCASNNDLDMFGEMRTTALLAKAVAGHADAFDAAATLHAATIGSAKAMGLDERIGSIEPGKQADLAAVRLDELESLPLYDVTSQLVYATGRHQVSDVWIAGKRQLADRHLIHIDADAIKVKARHWRERIAKI
ncbi:MAG TPA: TRZ/ATZ family hydrolase [Rhodanobacteraceae bacterium]